MSQRGEKNKKRETQDKLENWFSDAQRVVIVGIGNPLRKDDSIGIEIVKKLRLRLPKDVFLIECETVPENFIEQITEFKPTHILIIDAAYIGLKSGSSELIGPDRIAATAISTHILPLQIFCEYLALTAKAKLSLLLIQPRNTCFGEGLTAELEKSAENLTDLISTVTYRALAGNLKEKSKYSKRVGQALYTS